MRAEDLPLPLQSSRSYTLRFKHTSLFNSFQSWQSEDNEGGRNKQEQVPQRRRHAQLASDDAAEAAAFQTFGVAQPETIIERVARETSKHHRGPDSSDARRSRPE